MRLKCVSKLWRSIILDPSFASSYIGGSKGILICRPSSREYPECAPYKNFYFINLYDDYDPNQYPNFEWYDDEYEEYDEYDNDNNDEVYNDDPNPKFKRLNHPGTVVHGGGRRLSSTEVVNGLVCFFEGNYSCLYNVATRECRDLPLSHDRSKFCRYYLGFDGVSKLYKLLKICAVYDKEFNDRFVRNLNCEVLTLGVDGSWRTIDSAPLRINTQSKCFNGVIYWFENWCRTPGELIAFHLDQEKFEFVTRVRTSGFSDQALALIYHHQVVGCRICRAVIFPFHNNINSVLIGDWAGKNAIFNLPAGCGEGLTIKLPDSQGDSDNEFEELFSVQGMLPDGRVFIMGLGLRSPATFYLYHPVEKVLTEFAIIPSQSSFSVYPLIHDFISYHEENIISLRCLTTTTNTTEVA